MDKSIFFKSVLLGTLIVMCICGCGKDTAHYMNAKEVMETEASEVEVEFTETEEVKTLLYIYVCGAVQIPGVYTVPEGSRVCDVFEIAGGFTEDAAEDYWNQARIVIDGEMIYVPTKDEVEKRNLSGDASTMSIGNANDNTEGKVNINTASKEQLMTIPGIGEAKALAIIRYRQENGGFSSIDDVKKVEGIKDGVFTKMKEYIVIN